MNTEQILKGYQEYLDDFDPTPQHPGNDYLYPMSMDEWIEEKESVLGFD